MQYALAFFSLICVKSSTLCGALRKKHTEAHSVSIHTENSPSSYTQLRFTLPPLFGDLSTSFLESSVSDCGADTPSPFWSNSPRPDRSDLLSIPSGDAKWDQTLEVFLRQPAVEQVWSKSMEVWNCQRTSLERKAAALLRNEVPGLKGVTFQRVFATLRRRGCPVWILGGSVRDLISGQSPKDVDTSALCEVTKIKRIIAAKGWKVYANRHFKYYEIGTRHAEDGLEGKSIDTMYTHPSIADWTANMLLLDPHRMYVVDPSGRGISDAKAFRLTPATPGPYGWDAWRDWKEHETNLRHLRYLKFRVRGWQPYDECFRYHMANEMLNALLNEPTDENYQLGIFLFLAQHLKDETTRMDARKHFLRVLEEDMDRGYFEKDTTIGWECGTKVDAKFSLSAHIRAHASGLGVFRDTLVSGCESPPDAWKRITKKKRVDLEKTCSLLTDFYKWASRRKNQADFEVGDRVVYLSRRGRVHKAVVAKYHGDKNTYDLVREDGRKLRMGVKARQVLAL